MTRIDGAEAARASRGIPAEPLAPTDAATVPRTGLACVSASSPGSYFRLRENFPRFSRRRSDSVLEAAGSADRNVCGRALEHRPIREPKDADPAVAGISASAGTQLTAAPTVARRVERRRPDVRVAMAGVSDPPAPDFDGLPLDRCLAPGPLLPLRASRSCARDRAFRSVPFAGGKFRIRRPEQVVQDTAALAGTHGADAFVFVDGILALASPRGVPRQLIGRGHGFLRYGGTRLGKGLGGEPAAARPTEPVL
ncbi:hypothetical protein ACIBAI_21070 [Streptomyces sp. NPDC051041]|uniref:hypothetical protein n=1 Tax=Streptomyces sp. NPDC051041 TaxID=3365640 RepID=UPI003799F9E1